MATQNRTYSERDMMRMQQDAMSRVREMQERARQTVADAGAPAGQPSHSGQTRSNPGSQRRRSSPFRFGGATQTRPRTANPRPQEPAPPPPEAEPYTEPYTETYAEAPPPPPPPPADREEGGATTVIQDILGAVGLDDDRLLIAGLLLLLINAKADTTLILALAYLLI